MFRFCVMLLLRPGPSVVASAADPVVRPKEGYSILYVTAIKITSSLKIDMIVGFDLTWLAILTIFSKAAFHSSYKLWN